MAPTTYQPRGSGTKTNVTVLLTPDEIAEIDAERGTVSRSALLAQWIRERLTRKETT